MKTEVYDQYRSDLREVLATHLERLKYQMSTATFMLSNTTPSDIGQETLFQLSSLLREMDDRVNFSTIQLQKISAVDTLQMLDHEEEGPDK